jgi:O-methyltransferase
MTRLGRLARRILAPFGYQIVRRTPASVESLPPDFSPEVVRTVEAVRQFTMTSPERICALVQAVEYTVRNDIPGDIVECGVWRGGSMMAIAQTLLSLERTERTLFLFDTFDGMPPAADVDRNLRGERAAELMERQDRFTSWAWAVAQIDEVRDNLRSTHYPAERIKYVKGRVEDTIPARAPARIALLRLDTDWYASTRHELQHLFPRLSPGGVLIIDDYGHWQGARRAVDEYIEEHRVPLLLGRIDYTGRMAVKPWHGRASS